MITKTELFTGPYVPFELPELLPEGAVAGGQNIRKRGILGGWKGRPGYTLINTTSIGAAIRAVFQYTNPRWNDYHLITQVGGKLRDNTISLQTLLTIAGVALTTISGQELLARLSGLPLEQTSNMGDSIYDSAGATPGFDCVVGEDWIYADGSGKPLIYGGDTPTCDGFLVDDGTGVLSDFTRSVRDNRTDTYAVLPSHASMVYYVRSKEPANAIHLNFGSSLNNNVVTPTVKAWRSGAWASVSAVDGTSGTQTHDTDGAFTWTTGADEMRVLGNMMGYWYQVSFSGAMDVVTVVTCRVSRDVARITNKWDGNYLYPTGVIFQDGSAGTDVEGLSKVTNESESSYLDISSATTSDYLLVKAVERPAGVGIIPVTGSENTNAALIDLVEYWNGTAWTSVSFVDTTKNSAGTISFAQTGAIWVDLSEQPSVKRVVGSDKTAGHWIRISWGASLSADVKIATIVYAAWPDPLPYVNGCVEYNGRALYWGPFEYQNRFLISPYEKPDQLSSLNSRYSPPIGGDDIILSAKVFGQGVLVLKAKGVFYMVENSDGTFSVVQFTAGVGISSPKSLAVAELGESNLRKEEIISIAIWQDLDGFYKASTSGNILKISDMIIDYFDPAADDYMGNAAIVAVQGYMSPLDGTYRAILSDRELVYNIKLAEWYPPWIRELTLSAATVVKGTNNQYTLVGGTSEGFLLNLEDGLTDYDTSNTAVGIDQRVRTRVLRPVAEKMEIVGTLRYLWPLFKAMSNPSGNSTFTIYLYKNREIAGTSLLIPGAPSNYSATQQVVMERQDLSVQNTFCFEFEFRADGALNQVMELIGFTYAVDPRKEYSL